MMGQVGTFRDSLKKEPKVSQMKHSYCSLEKPLFYLVPTSLCVPVLQVERPASISISLHSSLQGQVQMPTYE